MQILRQKLSLQSELEGEELFSFVSAPFQMAFCQWLSSSPASLDIKMKYKRLKKVLDKHAANVISVLIQAGGLPPSQLITVQYFESH